MQTQLAYKLNFKQAEANRQLLEQIHYIPSLIKGDKFTIIWNLNYEEEKFNKFLDAMSDADEIQIDGLWYYRKGSFWRRLFNAILGY